LHWEFKPQKKPYRVKYKPVTPRQETVEFASMPKENLSYHRRRIISARRNISALGFWRTFERVEIFI